MKLCLTLIYPALYFSASIQEPQLFSLRAQAALRGVMALRYDEVPQLHAALSEPLDYQLLCEELLHVKGQLIQPIIDSVAFPC